MFNTNVASSKILHVHVYRTPYNFGSHAMTETLVDAAPWDQHIYIHSWRGMHFLFVDERYPWTWLAGPSGWHSGNRFVH